MQIPLLVIEKSVRRGTLLDLTFINKGGFIGELKGEGTIDFSDNEMAEFRILRGQSQAKKKQDHNLIVQDSRFFFSSGIYLKESHGIWPCRGEGAKKVGCYSTIPCSKPKSNSPKRYGWTRSSWQNLNTKRKPKNFGTLSNIKQYCQQVEERDSSPFLSGGGAAFCVLNPVLLSIRGTDILKRVQGNFTKMVEELEHLSSEETLKELGIFNLNRRLRKILNTVKTFEWRE